MKGLCVMAATVWASVGHCGSAQCAIDTFCAASVTCWEGTVWIMNSEDMTQQIMLCGMHECTHNGGIVPGNSPKYHPVFKPACILYLFSGLAEVVLYPLVHSHTAS